MTLTVLFRDADWCAVAKPSGVPTTAPETAGVISLVDRVRSELAPSADSPVHPISRLDVEVTGVVLFALSARALAAAERARTRGTYRRRYIALLAHAPNPREGTWEWPIATDPRDRRRRRAGAPGEGQRARTRYRVLSECAGAAWAAFDLETGRTHQIRVHAQRAGCPVLGDRAYGGARHVGLADGTVVTARRVMLHALRVVIPATNRAIECPPPGDFSDVWRELGGIAPPP